MRRAPKSSISFLCIGRRTFATLPTQAKVVRYDSHGQPEKVLHIETEALPPLKETDVLLKFLAAPINPADLNMVEGVYPIGPSIPAVGGSEGVAQVLAKGAAVKDLAVGDWVLPSRPGLGTWRTHAVWPIDLALKVRKDIKPELAATIAVNPCTAYRMLNDFVNLKEGDVVIQNGANSAVGQAVVQMAKYKKVKTINLVRERPDFEDLSKKLKQLGADVVVPYESVGTPDYKKIVGDLPAPRLGLNCVGGPVATEMARHMDKGATLVTYGGMSRKPLQIPTSVLIFKDIRLTGFWLSRWIDEHPQKDRAEMINAVWDMVKDKGLTVWTESHKLEKFADALKRATSGQRNNKVLLTME